MNRSAIAAAQTRMRSKIFRTRDIDERGLPTLQQAVRDLGMRLSKNITINNVMMYALPPYQDHVLDVTSDPVGWDAHANVIEARTKYVRVRKFCSSWGVCLAVRKPTHLSWKVKYRLAKQYLGNLK
jgi:hypothetical protein